MAACKRRHRQQSTMRRRKPASFQTNSVTAPCASSAPPPLFSPFPQVQQISVMTRRTRRTSSNLPPDYICPGCAASHRQFVLVSTLVVVRPLSTPVLLCLLLLTLVFCLPSSSCTSASPPAEYSRSYQLPRPPVSWSAEYSRSYQRPRPPVSLSAEELSEHQPSCDLLCPTLNKQT